MVNLCSSVTADSVNPSNGCGVGGRNDADLVNDKMIDQKTHEELRKLNPRDLTDDQLTTASLVGGVDFAALVESLRRSKISNDRSSKKMVWLSVAMIVLAVAQVVVAIIPLFR